MQITETSVEGLSRVLSVTIPASTLEQRLSAKIEEIRPTMQLKGFRPGKAPAAHVRKLVGKSLMSEIIETVVQDAANKAVADRSLRLAESPQVDMQSDVEAVVGGKADLAFDLKLEVMPEFSPIDPATLTLEKPVALITDEMIDEQMQKLADGNRSFVEKAGPAADGDALTIDFEGFIDGEAFAGGKAEDAELVIGAGRFIPGFEEGLVGVSALADTSLEVTFPADYPAAALAGKAATFKVNVKSVRAPAEAVIDNDLAIRLGLTDVDALRNAVRENLVAETKAGTRARLKRALLDKLDDAHTFELPLRMVDAEFAEIWRQYEQSAAQGEIDEDDKGKSTDDLRAEYRKIAERRVRLGLVIAEIGRKAKVELREEEISRALAVQARNFPGREREVVEFYRKNPRALAALQAPLYEEKVVDYILELVQTKEKTVTRDELLNLDETLA